jgi:sulfur-oxidizing protein SoxZ
MADPMRIRAQAAGDKRHRACADEPRDGDRPAQGRAGKTIPAWYIQEVTAQLNGKPVMTAQWGPAVSRTRSCSSTSRAPRPATRSR